MRNSGANQWRAYARPEGTSFLAMVCVAHLAEPYSLKKDGKPILYPTRGAADRAAHEHILGLLNSPIYAESYERQLSEHEKLQAQVFGSAAQRDEVTPESAFGVIYAKGRGGSTHQVKVERRRRRRAQA
ncbi:hypothetical protein [Mangrovibrevibacter kandeliae]|uniref:hypothetical protein n=1 Tax=Mangrovibrevibacter kandeliae TaxID=2968473 RepID=UPI00211846C4|nr:hypothetical protein [Aurantimonas sp. CSK15Z-1]MCQ8781685.1 hypothetical protein [Aurantimonas sp. CSK15Z-1]